MENYIVILNSTGVSLQENLIEPSDHQTTVIIVPPPLKVNLAAHFQKMKNDVSFGNEYKVSLINISNPMNPINIKRNLLSYDYDIFSATEL